MALAASKPGERREGSKEDPSNADLVLVNRIVLDVNQIVLDVNWGVVDVNWEIVDVNPIVLDVNWESAT
jgi:hypothetical protein